MKLKIAIDKIRIQHALDIYEIMQMVLKREYKVHHGKEHFWVLALDKANKIVNLELISMGNSIHTTVSPMDVLSVPLQKKPQESSSFITIPLATQSLPRETTTSQTYSSKPAGSSISPCSTTSLLQNTATAAIKSQPG